MEQPVKTESTNKRAMNNIITQVIIGIMLVIIVSYMFSFDVGSNELKSTIKSFISSNESAGTVISDVEFFNEYGASLSYSYLFTYKANGEDKIGVAVFSRNLLLTRYKVEDIQLYTQSAFAALFNDKEAGYSRDIDDYKEAYMVYVKKTDDGYALGSTPGTYVGTKYLLMYVIAPIAAAVIGFITTKRGIENKTTKRGDN
jgi:hypothetical protein